MNSNRSGLLLSSALILVAGCVDLPKLDINVCGNNVVEPVANEECDGEPGCAPPTDDNRCRFLCSADQPCPPGYGCGVDDVCRRGSGSFEPLLGDSLSIGLDMVAGDLNADGCHEIVSTSLRSIDVQAFDSSGGECAATQQTIPIHLDSPMGTPSPPPLVADLTGDGHQELIVTAPGGFGSGPLYIHVAAESPTLVPLLYANHRVEGRTSVVVAIRYQGRDVAMSLQPTGNDAGSVSAFLDPLLPPAPLGSLPFEPKPEHKYAFGELDVPEPPGIDGCDELIHAGVGATSLQVVRFCLGQSAAVTALAPIQLSGGARVRGRNAALALDDFNADGHLDVILNADDRTVQIAYGRGDGSFDSSAAPPAGPPDQTTSAFPLTNSLQQLAKDDFLFVVGEFDANAVGPEIVPLMCPMSSEFESPVCSKRKGACEARAADVNGDDHLDIVSTSAQLPDLKVELGNSDGRFHTVSIETACPPHRLAIADLDGNRVNDIAFLDQRGQLPDEPVGTLKVAWGEVNAVPLTPTDAGLLAEGTALVAGQFGEGDQHQLVTARSLPNMDDAQGVSFVENVGNRYIGSPFYLSLTAEGKGLMEGFASMTGGLFLSGPSGPLPALAVVTDDAMGDLLLLAPAPDGTSFKASRASDELTCNACVLIAIDTDGDEQDELVVLGDGELTVFAGSETSFVQRSRATSAFEFFHIDAMGHPARYRPRTIVADVDGDGVNDMLASANDGSIVAFWGDGAGGFEERVLLASAGCEDGCVAPAVALIDVDADGLDELMYLGSAGGAFYEIDRGARSAIASAASFPTLLEVSSSDISSLSVADFDGDGVQDVAVMASSSFLEVLRGVPVLQ
jgi:hypothetical protein